MEQKQELEANSEYYWNSQTGDFKQVINAGCCDGHSRQHVGTVDKVLRQNQKETLQESKDLLQQKWKKACSAFKRTCLK